MTHNVGQPEPQTTTWTAVLIQIAASLPGKQPVVTPASVHLEDDPPEVARALGLALVRVSHEEDIPEDVPVITIEASSTSGQPSREPDRWAVAPLIDREQVGSLHRWILRQWLRHMSTWIALGTIAAIAALLAIGGIAESEGNVALLGYAAVVLAGIALFGVALAGAKRRALHWSPTLEWFTRANVLDYASRLSTDGNAHGAQAKASSAGKTLSSSVRQLTQPQLAFISLSLAAVVVTIATWPPSLLLAVASSAIAVVLAMLATKRVLRHARAELSLSGSNNREPGTTMASSWRSRLTSLPVIAVAAILPLVLTSALIPSGPSFEQSDRMVVTLTMIALGASIGMATEVLLRVATTLSPVLETVDMIRSTPAPPPRNATAQDSSSLRNNTVSTHTLEHNSK